MNTNQIEWFCAAYESGSFAKGASVSFVSRQAFGKAIKALETELGVDLFVRDESGVRPTEAAQAMYPLMRRIMNSYRSIRETCAEFVTGSCEPIRIAVADGVMESLPSGFVSDLESACPAADISIEKHYYARCIELLRAGAVDFAICAGPLHEEGYEQVALVCEPVYIGVAPQDAVGRPRAGAELEDFADLIYYAIGDGESGTLGAEQAAERHGVAMRFDRRYSEYNVILGRVLAGGGAVSIPENAAERARGLGLELFPFPGGEAEWRVLFLYEDDGLSQAKRSVVEFMKAAAPGA